MHKEITRPRASSFLAPRPLSSQPRLCIPGCAAAPSSATAPQSGPPLSCVSASSSCLTGIPRVVAASHFNPPTSPSTSFTSSAARRRLIPSAGNPYSPLAGLLRVASQGLGKGPGETNQGASASAPQVQCTLAGAGSKGGGSGCTTGAPPRMSGRLSVGLSPGTKASTRTAAPSAGAPSASAAAMAGSVPATSPSVARAPGTVGSLGDEDRVNADVATYLEGLMPKQEIGATRFLEQHPHADGRGAVIAIFDSGVDPGAAGLQTTPQGAPKVIDLIDCTGSGDVDTSKVVKADADGFITSASGRQLRVSPRWTNPSGEWKVGSKRAFDLFNDSLLHRVKEERKKHWDVKQHELLTAALAQLAAFDTKHPKGSWENDGVKKQHEELQAKVDLLQSMAQDFSDPGPVVDAVVWHDGATWRAAFDTTDFHPPFMPSFPGGSTTGEGLTPPPSEGTQAELATPAVVPSPGESALLGKDDKGSPAVADSDKGSGSVTVGSEASGSGGVSKSGGEPSTREGGTPGVGTPASDAAADHASAGVAGDAKTPLPGRLEDFEPLADYSLEHRYATFSDLDLCNFAVKVYNDGDLLSIVTECSSHGTHVAGIAAAYHPENPSLNGVAPGAQIISCKIGDTRLGSMETNTALVRALIAVVQTKCDLINMSYGEPIALTDTGRAIELANEVVHKHGVIFVSSAGNSGPALSTVGAPGGTSTGIIGVGAYISKSLAAFGHSVIDPSHLEDGTQYTWSSRGPAADGALGVCVSAPGGAVAPVPTSSLQKRMLMNGTSMASPCACGGIALLVSALKAKAEALKQEGKVLSWGPSLVRSAIENTASLVSDNPADTLTYGRGLLQVDKAWEYLLRYTDTAPQLADLSYAVTATNARGGPAMRGIYLRDPADTTAPSEWQVYINPKFNKGAESANAEKASFEEQIQLHTTWQHRASSALAGASSALGEVDPHLDGEEGESGNGAQTQAGGEDAAPWVQAPKFVLLPYNGRTFNIRVDPTGIPPGSLEYGEVYGTDLAAPWRGPLFRIPITVIKPRVLQTPTAGVPKWNPPLGLPPLGPPPPSGPATDKSRSVHPFTLAPGRVERLFLPVPAGVTWAEFSIRVPALNTPIALFTHTMQVLPQRRYTYRNSRTFHKFTAPGVKTMSCILEGGATLELVLAQLWSSGSPAEEPTPGEVEVEFHGLAAVHGDLFLNGNASLQRLEVVCPPDLNAERLSPSITLNRLRTAVRPSEAKVQPLSGPRDALPNGRQIHALLLVYKFSVSEGGRFTPRFPLLNQRLYDNEYEGQFYMIFDSNKMLLSQEDCYPKSVKLGKGDYILRLQVRHDNTSYLDKLKKMPLLLDRALDDKGNVKLNLYSSVDGALTGSGPSFKSAVLFPGQRKPLFVAGPSDDKLPKDASPGSLLLGRATLGKLGGAAGSLEGNAPARLHVTYLVPQSPKSDDKNKNGGVVQEPVPVVEKVKEQLRDSKVKALAAAAMEKEKGIELFQGMAAELKKDYPTHLPLLVEILQFWDDPKLREEHTAKVLAAADDIIASVDQTKLALHFAMKTEPEATSYLKERKEREAERDALVDALYRKGLALALADPTSKPSKGEEAGSEEKDKGTGEPVGGEDKKGQASQGDAAGVSAATAALKGFALFSTTSDQKGSSSLERSAEPAASSGSSSAQPSTTATGSGSGAAAGAEGPNGSSKDATAAGGTEAASGEPPVPSIDAFEANFAEFKKWADPGATKHGMLLVVREKRAGRHALALKALLKLLDDEGKVTDKKLQDMRVDLLREVGWGLWADHHKSWNRIRFPTQYPVF